MVIILLIFSSIVSGVISISFAESFGRLSLKTFVYYISTSLLASLTGLFLVNLSRPGVKPGFKEQLGFEKMSDEFEANADKLGDTLLGIIPTNPIAAMARGDVLPLGLTLNMESTVRYECVAVIFIAQVYGFGLSHA